MVYVWPTWLDTYAYSNNLTVMRYRWRIVFFLLDLFFKRLFKSKHKNTSRMRIHRLKIDYTITSFLLYLTALLERFPGLCSIIKWVRLCIK